MCVGGFAQMCLFIAGKLCEGMGEQRPEFLQLPGEEKVIDVQIAYDYMLLLTESGCLYSMGKTAPGTCLVSLELKGGGEGDGGVVRSICHVIADMYSRA